tara:strand:- start:34 stop:258 length:225 start_codon:yes stop_codon:yes gene_type:complete
MYINKVLTKIEDTKNIPPRISDAILAINSNAKFTIINDDVDRIEWLESFTPIAKDDIITKYNQLKATWDSENGG